MPDVKQPWDRLDGEPTRWFLRFERYRLAGPGRELLGVARAARAERAVKSIQRQMRKTPGSWSRAYALWRWRERAEAWDTCVAAQVAAEAEAERLRIMSSGFALAHNRVKALNALADLLFGEANIYDRRWLPDVKAIGSGRDGTFEKVDVVHFNAGLLEQLRGALDDLAKETGGRVRSVDLTSGGQQIEIREVIVNLTENGETEGAVED